jgi:hypothetical protein
MLRRSLIGGAQVRIPVVRFSTLFERFLGRYEFPGHARDAGQKRRSRSEAGFEPAQVATPRGLQPRKRPRPLRPGAYIRLKPSQRVPELRKCGSGSATSGHPQRASWANVKPDVAVREPFRSGAAWPAKPSVQGVTAMTRRRYAGGRVGSRLAMAKVSDFTGIAHARPGRQRSRSVPLWLLRARAGP